LVLPLQPHPFHAQCGAGRYLHRRECATARNSTHDPGVVGGRDPVPCELPTTRLATAGVGDGVVGHHRGLCRWRVSRGRATIHRAAQRQHTRAAVHRSQHRGHQECDGSRRCLAKCARTATPHGHATESRRRSAAQRAATRPHPDARPLHPRRGSDLVLCGARPGRRPLRNQRANTAGDGVGSRTQLGRNPEPHLGVSPPALHAWLWRHRRTSEHHHRRRPSRLCRSRCHAPRALFRRRHRPVRIGEHRTSRAAVPRLDDEGPHHGRSATVVPVASHCLCGGVRRIQPLRVWSHQFTVTHPARPQRHTAGGPTGAIPSF